MKDCDYIKRLDEDEDDYNSYHLQMEDYPYDTYDELYSVLKEMKDGETLNIEKVCEDGKKMMLEIFPVTDMLPSLPEEEAYKDYLFCNIYFWDDRYAYHHRAGSFQTDVDLSNIVPAEAKALDFEKIFDMTMPVHNRNESRMAEEVLPLSEVYDINMKEKPFENHYLNIRRYEKVLRDYANGEQKYWKGLAPFKKSCEFLKEQWEELPEGLKPYRPSLEDINETIKKARAKHREQGKEY